MRLRLDFRPVAPGLAGVQRRVDHGHMHLKDHFFALHFGQLAQSVLASTQQAIPQLAWSAAPSAQHAVLQPVSSSDAAQTMRERILMVFMVRKV